MLATTASRVRTQFEVALTNLNALVAYAGGDGAQVPSTAGLNDRGRALLARTGGKDIARSWATVFSDTIELVNKFHDDDLVNRDVSEDEVEQVAAATLRAATALTARLNSLG